VNVVIFGVPGSGKTTYANEIREEEDIVFDLDAIAETLNPRFAKYKDRPSDVAWLVLAFRDILVKKCKNGMLNNRRIIVIVEREDMARSIARSIKDELVTPR